MQLGKYQLVRKLAMGGMAEVFLAKAAGPGGFEKTLVLKRILPHLVEDPSFVEMFLAEARLAAGLNHPHIVQIFDFGEAQGSYFLAMEYIDGPNLRRWEKQAASRGLRLPPAICAKVVASAAEGLAFAHEFKDPATGKPLGLIHRDVSPDNILVSRQGAVKVVDFGIAKAAGQKHRTQTGIVKGKVAYMPPEQVVAEPLDRRVDVYALGVVLYELLTGRLPFEAANELDLMKSILADPGVPAVRYRPDLPRVLQSILATALAKDRKARYPDCRALQADLERYLLTTGQTVGPYQIAQLVERVVDGQAAPSPVPTPATVPLGAEEDDDGPTRLMAGRGGRRAAPVLPPPPMPALDVAGVPTDRRAAPDAPTVKVGPSSAPSQRPILALLAAGAVLLAAGLGYVLFGDGPAQPPATAPGGAPAAEPAGNAPGAAGETPGMPAAAAAGEAPGTPAPAGDKAQAGADTAPEQPAGDAPGEEPGAVAEAVGADAPTPEEDAAPPVQAGGDSAAQQGGASKKAGAALGSVEFRIRPYAVVYLDGKKVGETPFAPIDVPAGTYAVTAVNRTLNKKVTRNFEVKAGEDNIFKLNLLEK